MPGIRLAPLRRALRLTPVLGPLLVRWKLAVGTRRFPGSAAFWDHHYQSGGASGPGSYGQSAQFKAEVINDLVKRKAVTTVLEMGCGDGNQLSLCRYPEYIGLDVSANAVRRCVERFGHDQTKSFFLYDPYCFHDGLSRMRADAAVSLEVVFHLVEDDVFALYMRHLFDSATQLVIVYSSNTEEQLSWTPEVRHRRFTDWVEREASGWALTETIGSPQRYDARAATGSVSDFYVFERT